MKISFLILVLASLSAFAETKPDAAKQEQMMKAFKEYSTPGAPHKVLSSMVGNWKYTSKSWESADAKPQEGSGTSKFKMILGGRFLQHDTKGNAMGMPFEGIGITGYDNIKGKYDTLWFDSMGTGIARGIGTFDSTTQTLKDTGEYTCPIKKEKTQNYRAEWKIVDNNNMTYSMFGSGLDNGPEYKQMEMVFKRAK